MEQYYIFDVCFWLRPRLIDRYQGVIKVHSGLVFPFVKNDDVPFTSSDSPQLHGGESAEKN